MSTITTTTTTTTLILTELDLIDIKIKPKHVSKGITSELLTTIWSTISRSLVSGEHGNLWVRLHANKEFSALCKGKSTKALKYLFPLLIAVAKKNTQNYVVVESDCNTNIPELARKAGLIPRYMNTEIGSQVNALRLKEGEDRWPKFRAIKESVSAAVLLKNEEGEFFVVVGKNKDNGAGRGRNLGIITGYREPNESFSDAARRELVEETGLKIPETLETPLIGETFKRDYYPGADDRNEVRCIFIDLFADKEKTFQLKKKEDKSWTLIQRTTSPCNSTETMEGTEIKASDDLAEVFVLPLAEAQKTMNPASSAYAKIQAVYNAVQTGRHLEQKVVSFCWSSKLQSYDDVIFTFVK